MRPDKVLGVGCSTSTASQVFFFVQSWVSWQSPLTRESSRNQESEQSNATIVPQLSVVADMTRSWGKSCISGLRITRRHAGARLCVLLSVGVKPRIRTFDLGVSGSVRAPGPGRVEAL